METSANSVAPASWRSRQKRRVEDAIVRTAKRMPGVVKPALSLWARLDRHTRSHRRWFASELANVLDYRVRVPARLVNGMRMRVVWNDFIGAEIYYNGCYEPDTVELFSALLSDGMVVVDIGAHMGQYTLLASGRVRASGQVHSFEPTPHTFRLLAENVALNRLDNVRLNAEALADGEGSRTLYLSDSIHDGFNSLKPPYQCDSGRTCEVPSLTLDEYLARNQVGRVDLIKMDVEGAECEVLRGATALLKSPARPFILLEFNPGALGAFGRSCAELAELLASNGYGLHVVEERMLEPYTPAPRAHSVFNVLAIPEARLAYARARLRDYWPMGTGA